MDMYANAIQPRATFCLVQAGGKTKGAGGSASGRRRTWSMGSARERWRSVCDGGSLVGGPRLAVPVLGREDRQPEKDQGGEKGSPGLLTPNRPPIENQSSPRRARQVGAGSAAIPFGALKLEAMHLQLA